MKERLRKHIEALFEETPVTKRTIELKEELYANSVERYEDLVGDGIEQEDAYKTVISSIGNIHELIDSIVLEEENAKSDNELYKKFALLKSIAASLYVLSFVVFFGVLFFNGNGLLAIIGAALVCIAPVGINVYTSNMIPKYKKSSNNVVEDFREWQSNKDSNKEIKDAVSGIIWLVTVIVYFLVSFSTGAWYITWVLFLVAVCIQIIAGLIFGRKNA